MLVTDQIIFFLSLVINDTCSFYQNCLIVHVANSQEGDMGQHCKKRFTNAASPQEK